MAAFLPPNKKRQGVLETFLPPNKKRQGVLETFLPPNKKRRGVLAAFSLITKNTLVTSCNARLNDIENLWGPADWGRNPFFIGVARGNAVSGGEREVSVYSKTGNMTETITGRRSSRISQIERSSP